MNTIHSLYERFRQLIRFALVGILNTIVDFGVFALVSYIISLLTPNSDAFIYILIANGISLFAWVTNSYFINRKWTFRQIHAPNLTEATKFYFVNSLSFFVSTGIIYLLCHFVFPENMIFQKVIAKICAAPIVISINFLGSKHFAFGQAESTFNDKE